MEIFLLKATAFLYLAATVCFILCLVAPKPSLAKAAPLVLFIGYCVHTLAFGSLFLRDGFLAVTQFRETLSFYSWLMTGVFLLAQLKYRLTVLGSIIAPLAFLMTFSGFAFAGGAQELPEALETYWLPLHVTFALLGNAVFALAFGVSLVYLFEEHQLKKKKLPIFTRQLPSLETLDRLNVVFLVWGFPLMTLGIITGSLWAAAHWGNYWSWEARQIASALTWILYGALLHGRFTAGVGGKKAAVLTVVGFIVVLGYFLWGDSVFPGRHGGRFD
jgi:cytochrome c-type biogenesis protein CcsB